MKYLCLAYYNPEKFAALAPADVQAPVSQCPAKDAELKKTGRLLMSASLEAPQVTDGPYAEAKEMVGGFSSLKRRIGRRRCGWLRCIRLLLWGKALAGRLRCTLLGFLNRRRKSNFSGQLSEIAMQFSQAVAPTIDAEGFLSPTWHSALASLLLLLYK